MLLYPISKSILYRLVMVDIIHFLIVAYLLRLLFIDWYLIVNWFLLLVVGISLLIYINIFKKMKCMSFEEAIKVLDSGIIIDIEVTPGSKSLSVPSGYNEWRKRIEVKLTKNAQKGKANEQLIESLAELFGISSSDILISSGATSSKKSLLIKGVTYQQAVSVFGVHLKG